MRYVLVMLGSLVGLVIVAYLLLCLLISVGCIYPANYAEQKINEAYDTILRADKVTAEMIPALCDYVTKRPFFVLVTTLFSGSASARSMGQGRHSTFLWLQQPQRHAGGVSRRG